MARISLRDQAGAKSGPKEDKISTRTSQFLGELLPFQLIKGKGFPQGMTQYCFSIGTEFSDFISLVQQLHSVFQGRTEACVLSYEFNQHRMK